MIKDVHIPVNVKNKSGITLECLIVDFRKCQKTSLVLSNIKSRYS